MSWLVLVDAQVALEALGENRFDDVPFDEMQAA